MARTSGRGGASRSSGGSSVAAGRKAKDKFNSKNSKARFKKLGINMPYQGPKRVKGTY